MAAEGARQEAARSRRPALPAADPILAAKVTAPDVPDWAVPRPRVARLDESLGLLDALWSGEPVTVHGPRRAGRLDLFG